MAGIPLTKITFVIRNQERCEGLGGQANEGKTVDLRRAEEIAVRRVGKNLGIEFLPPAIAILRAGGTFQSINEYRWWIR